MIAPATTAPVSEGSEFMAANVAKPAYLRNRAHVASADYRLADRWGCQVGTAKSRRERCVRETLDVVETYLALGDTAALGHILSLLDATLAGHPELPKLDAIYYQHDAADATEDGKQAEYRHNPCLRTARAWFDELGREGRSNEPVMAALRQQWGF
jgi:hypothetical protein